MWSVVKKFSQTIKVIATCWKVSLLSHKDLIEFSKQNHVEAYFSHLSVWLHVCVCVYYAYVWKSSRIGVIRMQI